MARQRRRYTLEFKLEAIRLVMEEGLPYTQVGADLGVDKSLIRNWRTRHQAGKLSASPGLPGAATAAPPPNPDHAELYDEIRRLKKENRILKEEREILKKATVNSNSQRNTPPITSAGVRKPRIFLGR